MNSELKPKIRFKGFTDDWEQRKLNNMCSIITKQTGFDYSATIKPSLIEHKIPNSYSFIQNKDFDGLNINLNTDFYIPENIANQFPKITLDTPSLLISISGKIGNVGFYSLKDKAFIGGAVGICKLLNPEDGILSTYELESDYGQKYFQSLIKASSHANITVEDIRNIELLLPRSTEERSNISQFLLNIDNLITLHQRMCDKLVELKKSLLKKMFPQNNSVIPEIRFKGFTDDWEQRKLKEMTTYKNGTGHEDKQSPNGKYELINLNSVSIDGGLKSSGKYINDANETLKENDLVMVLSDVGHGDLLGRVAIIPVNNRFVLNQRVALLRPNDTINPKFLFTCINSGQSYFKTNGAGSSQLNISKDVVEEFEPFIPQKEEQQRISTIFENIDNLITLHQRKHDKLNKIKQSLLNDMFV